MCYYPASLSNISISLHSPKEMRVFNLVWPEAGNGHRVGQLKRHGFPPSQSNPDVSIPPVLPLECESTNGIPPVQYSLSQMAQN